MLSRGAIWFGTSVAAREIVREKTSFRREHMVNLDLLSYLSSKLVVLSLIVGSQVLLLFVPLKLLDVVGLVKMPGVWLGLPQLIFLLMTAGVGVALGLLISSLVKTSETATCLVPLISIPQLLFSDLVGVLRAIGLLMPAAWSFDAMKRFSGLDTLAAKGSDRSGANKGLRLYRAVEKRNEEMIEEKFDEYKRKMRGFIVDKRQSLKDY